MNNIKVAHLVNQMGQGTVAGDIALSLNEYTNIDSVVISFQEPDDYQEKIPVESPSNNQVDKNSLLSRFSWLKQAVSRFDVIIVYHTLSGVLGSILARAHEIPIIAREGNDHRQFSMKVRSARTLTNLLCDQIVCVSQSVVDSYCGFERIVPNSKFQVINNGVNINEIDSARHKQWDLYSEAGIESKATVVGTAGMLIEQKNHSLLVNAIHSLAHQRNHNIHLVIAGDGPLLNELKQQTKDLGIADFVHFLGYLQREEVYKMLHQIDCYAMPSKWEGFSAAALQAMAVGIPCVFSNIPSFSSQYPDNLVYFHDPNSVMDLAEALESALSDTKDIGDEGRQFVLDNHTTKIMSEQYTEVVLKLFS